MSGSGFKDIEQKWRKRWEDTRLYAVREDDPRPKFYCLDMFPYPSGSGLHVGHWRGYVLSDVYARYYMMKGHKVLHPMGWDAFGAPAEDHALRTGTHPRTNTVENINNIRRQLGEIGACYDWSREVDTTDPDFYKWTQWIFLKWFEKGLAYREKAPVNWCTTCQAVLTNEEARQLPCGRGGCNLTTRELVQWKVRITAYADRLLEDLDTLDWPEKVKTMQRNWIGKSHGARVRFRALAPGGDEHDLDIFTTRADTLFGATYMVLAPEHPLVETLTTPEQKDAVSAYRAAAAARSEADRMAEEKEKTGVALGTFAVNPVNQEKIPLFIADYVLMGYGTGAIMAVPAHDQRDYAFAKTHGLPIRYVISPENAQAPPEGCYEGEGLLINSESYNGMAHKDAALRITEDLSRDSLGELTVQYRLRDWLFSRQRYWGEPIPIIICPDCGEVGVPEDQLPVRLPDVESYQPTHTGESPLANIHDWVNVPCPKCGAAAKRETNTMPTWAGSSWYYLRYCDPHNAAVLADPGKLKHWMPVDLYVGGVEHAILHLLYARFYTKFLFDMGVVDFEEPFKKLFNQGMITRKNEATGELLKMSKSKGNVVNPDELVEKYGADTIRLYELFIGPPEAESEWSDAGVEGVFRFLKRANTWAADVATRPAGEEPQGQLKRRHRLVREFEERLLGFRTNTLVSTLMEYLNDALALEKQGELATRETALAFVRVLAPMAPHLAEELHETLGGTDSVFLSGWPGFDEALSFEDTVTIAVQVSGKLRASFETPRGCPKEELEKTALNHEKVQPWLQGKTPRKIVVVPDRIVNIVM